ncbi:hypothetical protein J5Y09_04115 [Roseomonas sp. PWR1]|uniref:Uncharacterized protein n=1 Tax=Roseomonas nitratireducens TaxID=2820810 RepID=A0ABS4AP04_9PROT|nr:hypothetical protein [Neoroseomonas nitratireducens]MBP0463086.1 hypothetical protein [Neoroseomonas nitratireducens]
MKHDPARNVGTLYDQKAALMFAISEQEAALGEAEADGNAAAVKSASAELRRLRERLQAVEAGLAAQKRRDEARAANAKEAHRQERMRAAMVKKDALHARRVKAGRLLAQTMAEFAGLMADVKTLAQEVPESRIGALRARLPDELGALVATAAHEAGLILPSSPPTYPDTDEHRLGRDLAAEIERALGRVDETPPLAAE